MGTLDIGEGIVALADLGERRGEKGILNQGYRCCNFSMTAIALSIGIIARDSYPEYWYG